MVSAFLTYHYLLGTIPYLHIESFPALFVFLAAAVYSTVPSRDLPLGMDTQVSSGLCSHRHSHLSNHVISHV